MDATSEVGRASNLQAPARQEASMFRELRDPDWFGRSIGLVVFFSGIAMLGVVFVLTCIWLGELKPPSSAAIDWARNGATMAVRVAQLFIMGFVASWVAGRGAQMYAAANRC